jgi:hypothetical protein
MTPRTSRLGSPNKWAAKAHTAVTGALWERFPMAEGDTADNGSGAASAGKVQSSAVAGGVRYKRVTFNTALGQRGM